MVASMRDIKNWGKDDLIDCALCYEFSPLLVFVSDINTYPNHFSLFWGIKILKIT